MYMLGEYSIVGVETWWWNPWLRQIRVTPSSCSFMCHAQKQNFNGSILTGAKYRMKQQSFIPRKHHLNDDE
jgi:hypothetical protein